MLLTWRDGAPDDEHRLKQFTCARKQRSRQRTIFPYKWEKQVQSAVRTVTPSCDAHNAVLVGEDAEGIAAIVSVQRLRDSDRDYLIELIAVDDRVRRAGVGDEAMGEAFQWVYNHADAAGITSGAVLADTHPRNDPAKALLRRHGFGLLVAQAGREEWFYEFSLPMP